MRFLCVVGTRPEAIKLAPVILELARHSPVITVLSGQHANLAREPLDWFEITPDDTLAIGSENRTLSKLTADLLLSMERTVAKHKPDVLIAQGDTTTVLVTALTAFYLDIPFAHVEAGLRTGNLRAPFPEEMNRVAASRMAQWHFCPTPGAVANLAAEGIDPSRLFLTGNTGIDAVRLALGKIETPQGPQRGVRQILLTAHRRESHGLGIDAICQAVLTIIREFEDVEFIVPVHPNPAVRSSVEKMLGGHDRIQLLPPLSYQNCISAMARADLILTDSGGIQEEAPFLKKPVLVLRDVTERPEAVELGVARLVGTDTATIVAAVRDVLTDPNLYAKMASGGSPYGDGYAAQRIASAFGLTGDGRP
jgi:UDP-N-acetylglucosamine 2-epimerase (non-hydrolysing)